MFMLTIWLKAEPFSIKLVIIVLEVGLVCFALLVGPARALPVLIELCFLAVG